MGGIEQLVDMYKGNPGPLEAKVEKDQQGQKPGELPEDLEEAIALQKIADLQNGAKNQQAMQAGGAQPSIVEKLRQMLAANQRQQAQPPQMPQGMPQGMPPQQGMPQMAQGQPPMPQGPQGQPVMAARGGSIDQLMSNLGRHYAGGGIIAFTNGGDVPSSGEFGGFAGATPEQQAEAEIRAAEQERMKRLIALEQKAAFLKSTGAPQAQAAQAELAALKEGMRPKPSPTDPNFRRLPDPRYTGTAATSPDVPLITSGSSPAAAPRPISGGPAAPAAAAALDPNSLRGLIEANIRKELGKDEDAEWRKGSKRYEDFMGIDKLLQPREARIAERQEMLKRIQGERTPAWVEALSAAGRPVRGGLGTLLSQMGGAAESTRKGYSAEDLKFFDEIGAMQDEVAKLKLDGKYKAAAAGEAAIKDAVANKRQSEQSGASLVATDERTETSKQIARDAAAGRAQIAAAQGESRKAERIQKQQNWIAEQERKWQDTLNKNPEYKAAVEQRAMYERQLNISTNPKIQEQAQAAIDRLNEKIQGMMPTGMGGAANIPPPPKGAVTRVG